MRDLNREVILRIVGSAASVGGITWFFFHVIPVNATTVAFAYLLAILAVAAKWGLVASVTTSLLSVLCFNFFFLPPVGTLTIADPQNWVALVAFLITAIVASQLSDRATRRAEEAVQRQQEMEKLYEFSRAMLLNPGGQAVGAQICRHAARVFGSPAVTFYDRAADAIYRAGSADIGLSENRLKDVALQQTEYQDPAAHVFALPVSLGGHGSGSIAFLDSHVSEAALHAIANLAAIAIEREQVQAAVNRAEAARANEELKSTLLDAVAHEFQTPLTSIKAAATSLLSTAPADQQELLTVIDEEADRLSMMVNETIQMARIESGKVRLVKTSVALPDILQAVLQDWRTLLAERKLDLSVAESLPKVSADPDLIQLALREIVGNALKYSGAGTPLSIQVTAEGGAVVIAVCDRGCGIPEPDQARIFQRFYRASNVKGQVPGTGMGLAIVREIVQAHGGRVWFQSRPGQGAQFFLSLPAAKEAAA